MNLGLDAKVLPNPLLHDLDQLGGPPLVVLVHRGEAEPQLLIFRCRHNLLVLKPADQAFEGGFQLFLLFEALNLNLLDILSPEKIFLFHPFQMDMDMSATDSFLYKATAASESASVTANTRNRIKRGAKESTVA